MPQVVSPVPSRHSLEVGGPAPTVDPHEHAMAIGQHDGPPAIETDDGLFGLVRALAFAGHHAARLGEQGAGLVRAKEVGAARILEPVFSSHVTTFLGGGPRNRTRNPRVGPGFKPGWTPCPRSSVGWLRSCPPDFTSQPVSNGCRHLGRLASQSGGTHWSRTSGPKAGLG